MHVHVIRGEQGPVTMTMMTIADQIQPGQCNTFIIVDCHHPREHPTLAQRTKARHPFTRRANLRSGPTQPVSQLAGTSTASQPQGTEKAEVLQPSPRDLSAARKGDRAGSHQRGAWCYSSRSGHCRKSPSTSLVLFLHAEALQEVTKPSLVLFLHAGVCMG